MLENLCTLTKSTPYSVGGMRAAISRHLRVAAVPCLHAKSLSTRSISSLELKGFVI